MPYAEPFARCKAHFTSGCECCCSLKRFLFYCPAPPPALYVPVLRGGVILLEVHVQDYVKLYEQSVLKQTSEQKLERIYRLVRDGLPHAMAVALIILITRK